jgi:hypothetical protein
MASLYNNTLQYTVCTSVNTPIFIGEQMVVQFHSTCSKEAGVKRERTPWNHTTTNYMRAQGYWVECSWWVTEPLLSVTVTARQKALWVAGLHSCFGIYDPIGGVKDLLKNQ